MEDINMSRESSVEKSPDKYSYRGKSDTEISVD